jgi:hypothetical protein
MGHTGCLVAQDSALLTKVRTLIHEEISLLTVLYFPFRARTPVTQRLLRASDATPGTGEHPLTAPMVPLPLKGRKRTARGEITFSKTADFEMIVTHVITFLG